MDWDSVKRSNCYMVWGGDATSAAHASSRSNVDLEIGCLIDLATGLVMFTINGKEMSSSYQVGCADGEGRDRIRDALWCLQTLLLTFSSVAEYFPN